MLIKGIYNPNYFNIYDAHGFVGCIKEIPTCDKELINLLKAKGFNELERVKQDDDRSIRLCDVDNVCFAFICLDGGREWRLEE